MSGSAPVLTIHRSTSEIGGNCIEIACDGQRILLDAGSPLWADASSAAADLLPKTLNTSQPMDALVISHPHQDHFGLLRLLPHDWPVWSGAPTEVLIRMTASLAGHSIRQTFQNFMSRSVFKVGPFSITPYLTDHSAFDAHMLLVECANRRILYSGDFRRTGRKAALVDQVLRSPPKDIDVLLLEGTTLGRTESFPTEADLEEQFVALFRDTPGRVYVTWSAQNIDRTVTIYRACKRAGRTLILDLYTVDVLGRLSALHRSLPGLGWPNISAVVTSSMKRLYENPKRLNDPAFVSRTATSGHATSAAKLSSIPNSVTMLGRPCSAISCRRAYRSNRATHGCFPCGPDTSRPPSTKRPGACSTPRGRPFPRSTPAGTRPLVIWRSLRTESRLVTSCRSTASIGTRTSADSRMDSGCATVRLFRSHRWRGATGNGRSVDPLPRTSTSDVGSAGRG